MARFEGQLSPLKQQSRAPRFEASRLHSIPILEGLDALDLNITQERQLQVFAAALLREVAAWRHRQARRKEGVRHDA